VPVALDGAGPSAAGATLRAIRAAGHREMPSTGPWPVTVPGAVDAWATLLRHCGRLSLGDALAPAIRLARDGFEVTPVIAVEWSLNAERIEGDDAAAAVFLPGGRAPSAGERFANPDLSALLEVIAEGGPDAFYRGEPAARIAAAVERAGGPLRTDDLEEWDGARWVTPLANPFRDVVVFELPPPGQGIVALEAMAIFEGVQYGDRAGEEHAAIEAIKLAFDDGRTYLADPFFEEVPVADLLDAEHLAARRRRIGARAADLSAAESASDTAYVAAVDGDGGACSARASASPASASRCRTAARASSSTPITPTGWRRASGRTTPSSRR
jgi:gamma-glutamyltranspeptidase/glutathione hydrolase